MISIGISTIGVNALFPLNQHSGEMRELRRSQLIDGFAQIQLDNTIVRLCDAQGKAAGA
mgnify:CR=1 FL=1